MSTRYTIELAKSGRAACKKCKEKIGKGEVRIGVHSEFDDKVMTKWYKLECFTLPRKLNHLTFEEFLDDYLVDETGVHMLQDDIERQTIIESLTLASTKKTTKKTTSSSSKEKSASSSPYMQTIQQNAAILEQEEADDDYEDGPKTKRTKTMSSEDKKKALAYLKYKSMKNPQLQDILSWNKIVKTGSKDVLLTRIIDGYVYGRIGTCLDCGKGKPKISDDGSVIICNGFYDEENGYRVQCGSKTKIELAIRNKPWFDHEPTEEEEEMMKKQEENQNDEDDKENSNEALPDELINAVKKMEWNLVGKQEIKKALSNMVTLCSSESSPIDFPSDIAKAKMEIGTMIVQNRTKDAIVVLDLIVKKYGLKKKNMNAEKKRNEQVKAMVNVANNADIYLALQELSSLYFKEKNSNAGNAYRKVAQAVKELDFEITEDNAKGLGKGKTKVAGIGKGSAEKMYEFITTGTIAKLEEKRAAQA